jgi:hypothetical protein
VAAAHQVTGAPWFSCQYQLASCKLNDTDMHTCDYKLPLLLLLLLLLCYAALQVTGASWI